MLILPATPRDLMLDHLDVAADRITMTLRTTRPIARCPVCRGPATRVQSRYWRTLADLPWQGIPVQLHLQVRRFWCDTPTCPRRIFAERVPAVTVPYARRTLRLTQVLTQVAFALGGEPGARLLPSLGMRASPDTLLRFIRQTPVTPPHHPAVLGIDDFAFRRGCTYGTIVVDLDAHQPVDLLPERTAPSLAQWLCAQPQVTIIARDRSEIYAEGATQGAPQATQVADRWHLLKNIGAALERVVGRHPEALRAAFHPSPPVAAAPCAPLPPGDAAPPPPSAPWPRQPSLTRRQAQFTEVHRLHQQGLTVSAISRRLHVSRPTVRKYLRALACPERIMPVQHLAALSPHAVYLRRRWAEGCHNAARLWRELQAQGFTGSAGTVRRYVGAWRAASQHERAPPSPHPPRHTSTGNRPPSLHQVRRWLLRDPDHLTTEQGAYRARLLEAAPAIRTAVTLTRAFNHLVRTRDVPALGAWLQQAEASDLPEFAACAGSLQQDRAAIEAALRWSYSNGQTEGQITRLKLVKRAMYGRAKFDLLRQRVLYRAT